MIIWYTKSKFFIVSHLLKILYINSLCWIFKNFDKETQNKSLG
jgi:hypothetical protein